MALGDFRTSAADLTRSQTSSTTYQAKLQLTTPNVSAADYLIVASFLYQTDVGESNELQAELVEDIAGPATQIYETGELREANPGNAVGDSQDAVYIAVRRTLAAGVHTFDLNFRRAGSVDLVTIEEVRLEFFQLDASYQTASADGFTSTNSTTYQLKASLNTGAVPAGDYRVGFSVEYNNNGPGNGDNMGLRWRERKDPAGVNTITNLLGGNSGAGDELELNQGGWGDGAADPRGCAAWEEPCRELEADTYQYELHFRAVGGLFDDVGVALARLHFWRMS
jgi:hypothetical protein